MPGWNTLVALTKLKSLGLRVARITDAGLNRLTSLPLEHLDISYTWVTVAGLEQLKELSQLESLSLRSDLLTTTAVVNLKAIPRLNELSLFNICDEDLDNLKNLSQLRTLNLRNPLTTNECMKGFQQALPNCKVISSAKSNANRINPSGRRNSTTQYSFPYSNFPNS